MAGEPLLIGIRFALYADLMLLAGLAAFPFHALERSERRAPLPMAAIRRLLLVLGAAGWLLSALGMAIVAASMQGVDLAALEFQTLCDLIGGTDAGTAWIVRNAALVIALVAAVALPRWQGPALGTLAAAGAVAIATLIWSGHAGATEGAAGMLHRINDLLHLLAAAVWIGAIGAYLLLLSPRRLDVTVGGVTTAARSVDRFSRVGTICVLVIAATGLVNGQMIVGLENLNRSAAAPYGQLLLAKFALFGLMLALAAANRWRLTPALIASRADGTPLAAVAAMRRSLALEALAAVLILALVAWLGTLEPF